MPGEVGQNRRKGIARNLAENPKQTDQQVETLTGNGVGNARVD